MMKDLNRETGDHTKPVEKVISVPVGFDTYHFSVWCNRYVAEHLTSDDWAKARSQCIGFAEEELKRLVLSGVYLAPDGPAQLRERIEAAMRGFIYAIFRDTQVAAGNLQWQVDSLLKGEGYRV